MLHKGNQVQVGVDSVFPFAVFCHLVSDGSQGYIRRRELSMSGQTDPRQLVKPGDELAVVVANLPTAERIVELSWRRAQHDPWLAFGRQTQPGDVVTGIVKYVRPDRVEGWIMYALSTYQDRLPRPPHSHSLRTSAA